MKLSLFHDNPRHYFMVGLAEDPASVEEYLRLDEKLWPADKANAWSTLEEAQRECKVQQMRMGAVKVCVYEWNKIGPGKFDRKKV